MLRNLLLLSCLLVAAITTHAQTFKITNVDYNSKRMNNPNVKGLLGKTMTLTFAGRSVRVVMAGDEPVVLMQIDKNHYSVSGDYNNNLNTMSWYLKTEPTHGNIKSVIYKVTIAEKQSPFRSSTLTIIGKRF